MRYKTEDRDNGRVRYFKSLKDAKKYVFNAAYRWCSTGGWNREIAYNRYEHWERLSKNGRKEAAESLMDHWRISVQKKVIQWVDISA